MRKFKLLLISVLFPCMCMGEGAYHEDNEFIIRAGFTGSHLRYKDNIGGTVNVSTPCHVFPPPRVQPKRP